MSLRAAGIAGYSSWDAFAIAEASRAVDSYEPSHEEGWEYTRWHAMAGVIGYDNLGKPKYQSKAQAWAATAAWVSQNYMMAQIDRLVWGDMDNYYKQMGFALHAVQDQWCPSHNFQEWHKGEWYKHASDIRQINKEEAIKSSVFLLQGNIGKAIRWIY